MTRLSQLATFALLLSLSFYSHPQIYKWTDSEGKVHYSDKKPANSSAKSIKVRTQKSAGSASNVQEQAQELEQKQQQELEAKAEDLQKSAEQRKNDKRCQALRDNLKKMNENSRIKIKGDDGELRYLSPEEIDERKRDYQEMLEQSC